MKKLLTAFVLLLQMVMPVIADGPLFGHKDKFADQEFTNVYHDIGVVKTSVAGISSQWAAYRRPVLTYVSATAVDVEGNSPDGTANETCILFPDADYRCVTEDTSSANKYRRFLITATANFTSGTEDSGLRSSLSEATDQWYAIYAVKSQIDTTKFVLVGDTTPALRANVSTLNTNFGTDAWVYLGLIRNGDGSAATGDIVSFVQNGPMTMFRNAPTSQNGGAAAGVRLAAVDGTSLTYSYSAGMTGAVIPGNIGLAYYYVGTSNGAVVSEWLIRAADNSTAFGRLTNGSGNRGHYSFWGPVSLGVKLDVTSDGSGQDIDIVGWMDQSLGVGPNPLI